MNTMDWAEPLIGEQVLHIYDRMPLGRPEIDRLVSAHIKMWLSLIHSDQPGFSRRKAELGDLAEQTRLSPTVIDHVDRAVLRELIDVITTRFRRCYHLRTNYMEQIRSALSQMKQSA